MYQGFTRDTTTEDRGNPVILALNVDVRIPETGHDIQMTKIKKLLPINTSCENVANKFDEHASTVKKYFLTLNVFFGLSGDQVIEWDGSSLQDATFEEAHEIMSRSGDTVQLVLMHCRLGSFFTIV